MALEELRPVLQVPGVRFVSMQHDSTAEEEALARSLGIATWGGGKTLDEAAALITALDLVISVANSSAHLTGALGRPGWVMLNESPEWRWLGAGEACPWYPSLRLLMSEHSTSM